jgi:hypothetical protein
MKEKWGYLGYTIIIYPSMDKYVVRLQGRHIITEHSNRLNDRLEEISRINISQKA